MMMMTMMMMMMMMMMRMMMMMLKFVVCRIHTFSTHCSLYYAGHAYTISAVPSVF
jgi:hypothetical protein